MKAWRVWSAAAITTLGVACGQHDPTPVSPESPVTVPAGKRAPCSFGADQTCNADPSVSALWGRCTELGVCECNAGFVLDPRGSCEPLAQ
jgi:hypothetical protein